MDNTPSSENDSADDPSVEPTVDPSTRTPAARPSSGSRPRAGRFERQLARRRQRERVIGVLIAVLGIAVLVVAFIALRNPHHAATAAGSDTHQSTPQAAPTKSPSSAGSTTSTASGAPSSSRASVIGSQPLIVLNQTTTADLAQQAAQRFRHAGWRVTATQEGYENDVITTTAYYDPATAGAKRAALALQRQFATIHRVAERFPELPAGPVVVVLTTDYAA